MVDIDIVRGLTLVLLRGRDNGSLLGSIKGQTTTVSRELVYTLVCPLYDGNAKFESLGRTGIE